ncbi:hypothetical protein JG687_00013339 [Phytophthora cactorum]|uniref:DDE-1 domain-containing protein n=1 Tax=Phytophthora cactorum TaxID=29920 RepID=A0A8T1U0M4_9STRA|nr:hypothetical protein JG687_00013339 [Phytophthora cactorum]
MSGDCPRPWQPLILLVDGFSGHWTPAVKYYASSVEVHLMLVPSSCTATCQPADVAWNRTFKAYLLGEWVAMLRRQLQDHEGSTSAFEFKPPKRPTLCAWVCTSWNKLCVDNQEQFPACPHFSASAGSRAAARRASTTRCGFCY